MTEDRTLPTPPANHRQLSLAEIGNTYVYARDRFVVSLVAGYGDQDGITTPLAAAAAALDLTRDGGSEGTCWYVHDRQTGETVLIEQGEIENPDDDGVIVEQAAGPSDDAILATIATGKLLRHLYDDHGLDFSEVADAIERGVSIGEQHAAEHELDRGHTHTEGGIR